MDRLSAGRSDQLKKARLAWTLWFALLVLSAFIVPYAWLGRIPRASASFLYWVLFALAAVVSTGAVMRRWRD